MVTRAAVFGGVFSLLAFTGPVVDAQGIDFSGRWSLDREASQLPQGPGGARGGRGGGAGRGGPAGARGGGGAGMAATVTVTQSESDLVIEQQGAGPARTIVYRLDGSRSRNEAARGTMTTTTAWDGPVLVTEGSQTLSTPRGDFTLNLTERRTLSDDGRTMTVSTTRTTPRGDVEAVLVYRKQGSGL